MTQYTGPIPIASGVYAPTFPTTVVPTRTGSTLRLTAAPPTRILNAMRNDAYLLESPVTLVAGASWPASVVFQGVTTVASPTVIVYKDGADVTSTVMPAGSHTASGNIATMKPLTALTGGEQYVLALTVTADGATDVKKCVVNALSDKEP